MKIKSKIRPHLYRILWIVQKLCFEFTSKVVPIQNIFIMLSVNKLLRSKKKKKKEITRNIFIWSFISILYLLHRLLCVSITYWHSNTVKTRPMKRKKNAQQNLKTHRKLSFQIATTENLLFCKITFIILIYYVIMYIFWVFV